MALMRSRSAQCCVQVFVAIRSSLSAWRSESVPVHSRMTVRCSKGFRAGRRSVCFVKSGASFPRPPELCVVSNKLTRYLPRAQTARIRLELRAASAPGTNFCLSLCGQSAILPANRRRPPTHSRKSAPDNRGASPATSAPAPEGWFSFRGPGPPRSLRPSAASFLSFLMTSV